MNEFSLLNNQTPAEEKNSETENVTANSVANENSSVISATQPPIPIVNQPNHSAIPVQETNQSAGLIQIPAGTFEHDLAIGDRYQNFSGELLRIALLGIAAVGFLLLNFLFGASDKSPEMIGAAKKTLANSDFRFYVYATLFLFGFSAGFALLHRYFAADSKAYHLKYLRLREKLRLSRQTQTLENVSHLIPHSRRGFFDGFWIYLFGSETDDLTQQIENEKEVRDFLFRITRWLLFLSGLLLWLGAISLVLAFGVIFKQFGA